MVGRTRKRNYDEERGDALESSAKRVDVVTPRIPLSYGSLKCVLEYLEPNRRFEVFRRLPSVRTTETLIPLNIKDLRFDGNSVAINDVTYSLGIYWEFNKGKSSKTDYDEYNKPRIPHFVARDNNLRGTQNDLDEYGYREDAFDEVLYPGDIYLLEEPRVIQPKMTQAQAQRNLELLVPRRQIACHFVHLDTAKRLRQEWADKVYFLRHFVENRPPPFDYFIQLTVEAKGQEKQIRRLPYTMKLSQALKILTTTFFHHKAIVANRLIIPSNKIVLRLPRNLKLQTRTVSIDKDAERILKLLKPITAESSFPLHSLEVNSMGNFNLPMIRNDFKTLIIFGSSHYYDRELHNFPKITHVVNGHWFELSHFLRHWLQNHKEIGTCVTAGFDSRENAMKLLERLRQKNEFDLVIREESHLEIQVNDYSVIKITVEANPIPTPKQQSFVKMEMAPIGFD